MADRRRQILEALAEGPVSGPALAAAHDISRAAVWKHIEALRADGFGIESTGSGYTLESVPAYNAPAIEFGLETPFSIEYHDSIGSTNDRARELATDGESDVAVVADEQTAGRGRLERHWESPTGGIWLSLVCRPAIPPTHASLYTLAGAVAVTTAAREAGIDAQIKWPNDVVVPVGEGGEYEKLAGILTEMEAEMDCVSWLTIGIGINANIDADAVPPEATTVRAQAGDADRRVFVQRLLETFHDLQSALEDVVPAWREHALTPGQRVCVERVDDTVVGKAVDITETGALVVERDDRRRVTVAAGDCEHLRPD